MEVLERRAPKDIDVVSFVEVPDDFEATDKQVEALDHDAVKAAFMVDSYFVEINLLEPAELVRRSAYWYSMWSHRRNQAWKGYLEVELDPSLDQQARDWLARQDTTEVQA